MKQYYELELKVKNLFQSWQSTQLEFAVASKNCLTVEEFEHIAISSTLQIRLLS